jgi:hypothetical protein
MGHVSGETNPLTAGADYSIYTLQQLLEARHRFDANRYPDVDRSLREEIEKRCAHVEERTEPTETAGTEWGRRFRPYGLILGVFSLMVSTGPFVAVEFLDAMNLVTDVNGDSLLLSGAWALLTLPFAVLGAILGGMMDAERVVKWFNV